MCIFELFLEHNDLIVTFVRGARYSRSLCRRGKARLELVDSFFSKLNDHTISRTVLLRSFQSSLSVFVRFQKIVNLLLVLLLLKVHVFKILRQQFFYFTDAFFHSLVLDAALFVLPE